MRDDSNVLAKAAQTSVGPYSRLALASYVSAILTLAGLLLGVLVQPAIYLFLFFAPAIVLGHLARRALQKRPDYYRGRAMSTFGLAIGYLGLFLSVLAIGAILSGSDGSGAIAPVE